MIFERIGSNDLCVDNNTSKNYEKKKSDEASDPEVPFVTKESVLQPG